jgi:hypothetical protein
MWDHSGGYRTVANYLIRAASHQLVGILLILFYQNSPLRNIFPDPSNWLGPDPDPRPYTFVQTFYNNNLMPKNFSYTLKLTKMSS